MQTKHQLIIQQFISGATIATTLSFFEDSVYGGEFYYYRITQPSKVQRTVCLLSTDRTLIDPLHSGGTFPVIDGVESGMGFGVVGCFKLNDSGLSKLGHATSKSDMAAVCYSDSEGIKHYLYLLAAI